MAFSQSRISEVDVANDGSELFISWVSPAPQGGMFQVYVDHRLAWYGTRRTCHTPIPSGVAGRNIWVDVGTVLPSEAQEDFSASLMSLSLGGPQNSLKWLGGTYLDTSGNDDLQGFRIYRGLSPGSQVDWSSPIEEVPAYPGGWVSDGFGLGGFGLGGFGRSANTYIWTSESLASGTWNFAVVPFDKVGNNRGNGQNATVIVMGAPMPPSTSTSGQRLAYVYSGPSARQITLNWSASPSSTT